MSLDQLLVPLVIHIFLCVFFFFYFRDKKIFFLKKSKAIQFLSVYSVLYFAFFVITARVSLKDIFLNLRKIDTLLFFVTVLVVPSVEEYVYRFGVFELYKRVTSERVALVLTTLIFTLLHVQFSPFYFPVGVLLLAVISQYLYIYTGSILPSIIFHSLGNLSVYLFMATESRWFDILSVLYLKTYGR